MRSQKEDVMECDYLLPAFDYLLTPDHEMISCLRRQGHQGDHLSLLTEGRHIAWAMERSCSCEDEDCQCFTWGYVSPEEAASLLETTLP